MVTKNACSKKSTREKMTTWMMLLGLLALTCGVFGAPISPCPNQCSCTASENAVEAHCQSFDFLKKSLLSPEQINAIVTLDITKGSTMKTNPDLSHLRNLKHLSMTSIKIQQIIAAHFPKSLEYLDLSRNSIRQPPRDLHLLPALKEVNLFGNPISCSCDSLAVRDALLEKGVSVTKPIKCDSPEDLRGKMWLSATCKNQNIENLFGEMQGDAPYEGSGSGDIGSVTETEPIEKADDKWDTIEEEFIPVSASSNIKAAPPQDPTTEVPELEGSGDEPEVTTQAIILEENQETTTAAADYDEDEDEEGYEDLYTEDPSVTEPPAVTVDLSLLENTRVRACNFNCSTPSPLPDETDASPPPDFFEGWKIVANDLGAILQPETTTTSTTTSTSTTEQPTTPLVIPEQRGIPIETNKNKTLADAEVFENVLKTEKEKENIQEQTKQSHNTFIFLSVLLAAILCLVVYAVVKKRALNRRNHRVHIPLMTELKEKIPEEMELIKKVAPENDKPNGTHETIPLMNGHNENQHKNTEEPVIPDANDAPKAEDENGDEDVDLRPKKAPEQQNLLTPEAKRVTIKASEIPNSTPKTPILVTRHVNSDGSIVTTPSVDQNV